MAIDPAQQPPMTALGRRIITHRDALGFSQRDLAAMVGITPNMLHRIEHGQVVRGPRIEILDNLAIALRISLMELLQDHAAYVDTAIA